MDFGNPGDVDGHRNSTSKPRKVKKKKKIMNFSSHQWKGGGIDGRVIPRTGTSDRIVLTHCADTRPGSAWWGNDLLLLVLKNLTGFSAFLQGSVELDFLRMGTVYGIYPWDTGDGKFDGETFWVGCGFFS